MVNSFLRPGSFISEISSGSLAASIVSHSNAYMLIYSTQPGAPVDTPYPCSNIDDFANVFGTSAQTFSYPSAQLYFNQRCGAPLTVVNCSVRPSKPLSIPTVTVGADYSLTVDGYLLKTKAVAGDTQATILARIAALLQASLSAIANIFGATIRYNPGLVITGAGISLGAEVPAPTYPTVGDVVDSLYSSFTSSHGQGFICAPEFFRQFTVLADRQALANGIYGFCADPNYLWFGLVDCGLSAATASLPGLAVNLLRTERTGMAAPLGHTSFVAPYATDIYDQTVPLSAAKMAVWIKALRDNLGTPPAGVSYPIAGVKALTVNFSDQLQELLNPQGINLARALPRQGIVFWGSRTLSDNVIYRFENGRVVLNVLEGSIKAALLPAVFSLNDGLGVKMSQVAAVGFGVCERLRKVGALFGQTPAQAYRVICNETNNPPAQLQEGILTLTIYVKISPTIEVIVTRVIRASLADNLEAQDNGSLA